MEMQVYPREIVILAMDFSALVNWYRDVLGFDGIKDPEGNPIGVVDMNCP